jgi:hypothetical protein
LGIEKPFGFETVKIGEKMDLTLHDEMRLAPRGPQIGPKMNKGAPDILKYKIGLWV